MITFEGTRDLELVRLILTHPKIYGPGSDDFSPNADEWMPPAAGEHLQYMLVKEDEEIVGLFTVLFISPILYKIDGGFLPVAWGKSAEAACCAFIQWLWENTGCLRIVCDVPEYNDLSLRMTRIMGMKKYGENPQAYLKHRTLHNVELMGISRPKEIIPCLQ
jgi:RimJ/RimL family protein N-acetyltransferase